MDRRDTKKVLVQFARREFREKRPLHVKVVARKPQVKFRIGFPDRVSIMRRQQTQYLVLCEYEDHVRVYLFSKNAELLGAENLKLTPKLRKELTKTTKKIWEN
ncbi:MAG: hypothetical protein GF311_12625 [Candidatus Lokiarchaeota archaeon]|nr:hypothetical protein [Candidatus Lokiarchaeota archaeon]